MVISWVYLGSAIMQIIANAGISVGIASAVISWLCIGRGVLGTLLGAIAGKIVKTKYKIHHVVYIYELVLFLEKYTNGCINRLLAGIICPNRILILAAIIRIVGTAVRYLLGILYPDNNLD